MLQRTQLRGVILASSMAALGMSSHIDNPQLRTNAKLAHVAPAPDVRATAPAPALPAPTVLGVAGVRKVAGVASWYGSVLQGHHTASGERFNMTQLTAAHRDLPFGSRVKVTNLRTGRSVIVRINDRGPMEPLWSIDLSYAAARQLRMIRSGIDPVTLELLEPTAPPKPRVLLAKVQ